MFGIKRDILARGSRLGIVLQDETYAEYEKRVLAVERHDRDRWLLLASIFSSLASVLSAIAAWFAVLK
jgi:hypothetical protein